MKSFMNHQSIGNAKKRKNGAWLLVTLLVIVMLAGCQPDPQENVETDRQEAAANQKDHGSGAYQYEGPMQHTTEGRTFELLKAPESEAEEVVILDYLTSIAWNFDAKSDLLAPIEPHRISIENEKNMAEVEGYYLQHVVIHYVETLPPEVYTVGIWPDGHCNDYYYDGVDELVDRFDLTDFAVVNVDYETSLSQPEMSQWGEGRFLRGFLVGRLSQEEPWRIYDYAMPVNR